MAFDISVKEYINKMKNNEIDYEKFISYVNKNVEKIQKKYNCFRIILRLKPIKTKGKLFGLPVSFKDCICTKDVISSAGSRILENYKPIFDATVVKKIKQENGQLLGKTNQDAFGFGTFCVNCDFGIPKNPIDEQRTCGGSSGGSACITKVSRFPHISIAESTGGSISCPAAFCSIVGITPTYGLVSRYGLIDYANSLDKIGVMAKNVNDAFLGLNIIAGYDEKDATSINMPTKFEYEDARNYKIALPKEYFNASSDEVNDAVWDIIKELEAQGVKYEKISLSLTKYAIATYYIIACSEASTNLAKYCGLRYGLEREIKSNESFNNYYAEIRSLGFNKEVKRRIILGTFARMSGYRDAYYLKAMKIRTLIINEFKRVFKRFDVIVAPTMPIKAPTFEEISQLKPIDHYNMDILTIPPNLAGLPMINVPSKKDMIGVHIIADHLKENKIFSLAKLMEGIK